MSRCLCLSYLSLSLFLSFIFLRLIKTKQSHGGFPGGTSRKESTCQSRRYNRCGFDPWVEKIPGVRTGNPHQYSCLENSMGRGAWQAKVHGVAVRNDWVHMSRHAHTHTKIIKLLSYHFKQNSEKVTLNTAPPQKKNNTVKLRSAYKYLIVFIFFNFLLSFIYL